MLKLTQAGYYACVFLFGCLVGCVLQNPFIVLIAIVVLELLVLGFSLGQLVDGENLDAY